ncbi:MAG: hypothetical protein R3F14_08540 [Polyangiaceae bacterium]
MGEGEALEGGRVGGIGRVGGAGGEEALVEEDRTRAGDHEADWHPGGRVIGGGAGFGQEEHVGHGAIGDVVRGEGHVATGGATLGVTVDVGGGDRLGAGDHGGAAGDDQICGAHDRGDAELAVNLERVRRTGSMSERLGLDPDWPHSHGRIVYDGGTKTKRNPWLQGQKAGFREG